MLYFSHIDRIIVFLEGLWCPLFNEDLLIIAVNVVLQPLEDLAVGLTQLLLSLRNKVVLVNVLEFLIAELQQSVLHVVHIGYFELITLLSKCLYVNLGDPCLFTTHCHHQSHFVLTDCHHLLVLDVSDDEGVEIARSLEVLPQEDRHVGSGEHHAETLLLLPTQ